MKERKKSDPEKKQKTAKTSSLVKENSPTAMCLFYSCECLTTSTLPILPILKNITTSDNER